MNILAIMGRLTADPELKITSAGTPCCNFTVAVDRPHTKDKTDFLRCAAWRNTADFVKKYFHKGKMIAISGILTTRSWKGDEEEIHCRLRKVIDGTKCRFESYEEKKGRKKDD